MNGASPLRTALLVLFLIAPFGVAEARAATVSWVTDADGFWDVGANWSTGNPPQAGDDVVINRPGFSIAVTIRFPTAAIATLDASEMVNVESTLTATGDVFFDGGLLLTSLLDGAGTKQLRSTGQWSSGTIASGPFVVGVSGTLTIGTNASHTVSGTTLTNNGTVTWTDGPVTFDQASTIVNSPGGVWDVQGDRTINGFNNNTHTFANAGTLRRSAGTGLFQITIATLATFVNTGTIELQTGSMAVTPPWTTSGLLNLSAGTTLNMANGTLQAGSTFSGSGTLSLPGTTTIAGNLTVTLPTTLSGTLSGAGIWTVGAPMTWASGIISAPTVVAVGQTLTINTGASHTVSGTTLANSGTVTWTDGPVTFDQLSTIVNNAGALWDVRGDLTINGFNNNTHTFTNAGTLRKSVGTGQFQFTFATFATFANTGTIDLQTGSMAVTPPWTTSGLLNLSPGTTLNMANGTLQAGSTFSGSGTLSLPGTTTIAANLMVTLPTTLTGTLTGPGFWTVGAPMTWASGIIGAPTVVAVGQTLTINTGASHTVSGTTLTNNGTVTWMDGPVTFDQASTIINAASGVWDVKGDLTINGFNNAAHTFTNAGTLRKSAGAGLFQITIATFATFANTGTIELQTGSMAVTPPWTTNGLLNLSSGTTLNLSNATLQAGSTFSGSGTLSLPGTTTIAANLTVTLPTTLSGTLNGAGFWTVGAPMTWASGIISAPTVVAVGQTLTINTGASHTVSGTTLTNNGTVTWMDGPVTFDQLSAIVNSASGVWDVKGDLTVNGFNNNTHTFTNAGTLRKSAGAGLFQITIATFATVSNTGTIELETGSMAVTPPWTTSGLLNLSAGTTLNLSNATLQAGSTFSGTGTLSLPGTTTIAANLTVTLPTSFSGTLNGPGTWTLGAPMTWSSGASNAPIVIAVGQTLTFNTGAAHTVDNTTLTNHGTVTWMDGPLTLSQTSSILNGATGLFDVQGDLTINGAANGTETVTNAGRIQRSGALGTISIVNPVSFTNTGVVAVRLGGTTAGQYDRVLATAVSLGGTLDVTLANGFLPTFNDTFNVMTYTSRNGAFGTLEGHDHFYEDSYNATTLTLTCVEAPDDEELIRNGDFSQGTSFWTLFGAPTTGHLDGSVVNEIMQWRRLPGVAGTAASQGVIFQETGAAIPNDGALTATFKLGNTAATRKYVKVLLVSASDFSDLSACTFWLAPNTPLRAFTMKTHTTKASTNIALYFYASSVKTDDGFYLLDDVSLKFTPEESLERTDCIDSLAPAPTLDPDSENLVNGGFSKTTLPPWTTFGTVTVRAPVTAGVLEFTRPTNAFPPGVVLQPTNQAMTANLPLTATLQLGNSSGVRKRVLLIVHDNDFSDLAACTWWLEPGQALANYAMKLFTTKAWTNATVSIYASSIGVQEWTRVDNVTLRRTPSATTVGTECLEGSQAGATVASWAGLKTGPSVGDASAWAVQYGAAGLQTGGTRDLAVAGSPQPEAGRDPASVLTLDPIDLTIAVAPRLTFESWLSGAAPRGEVQVSLNGSDWITSASVAPSDAWQAVDVDLRSFVGEVIRVRFVFHSSDTTDRWNIQEIVVHSH